MIRFLGWLILVVLLVMNLADADSTRKACAADDGLDSSWEPVKPWLQRGETRL